MLRNCKNCDKEYEGTERKQFCSDKCRVQYNRDKGSVTENTDSVTERKYTKTDKEFQDYYSAIPHLGPNWLTFSDDTRNPKCGQCGKQFKTRLRLLSYCSLKCKSESSIAVNK